MFDWLKDVLVGGAAAFFGGMLSLVFGYGYWTRLNKRVDDGAKEVKHLRDDSFAKLEQDVKDHIKEDKSQQILTEMKNVTGMMSKVSDKVDALGNETAKQGAQIKAGADYTSNLYNSIQNLRKEVNRK
jgi:Asp-tRNA(Asn)/Glu-tRNA(Gln) amidotransferase C subunit